MDGLVFKNIPAEGFDTQTGYSDRFSNPTPSRTGGVSDVSQDEIPSPTFDSRLSNPTVRTSNSDISFSGESTRLSNPTPSRRGGAAVEQFTEEVPAAQSVSDPFSRASNPTPTRRGAKEVSPFGSAAPEAQGFSSFSAFTQPDDPYSRASNPTPTRRKNAVVASDTDLSLLGIVPGADVSRASNPTPTRRGSSVTIPIDISPIIEDTPSLSFSSVTDPYGAGLTEDSRASNPTPTRRVFGSDEAPSDDDYDDSSRLSNITSSSRK